MGYGQSLAQRRRAKRFAMENLCQKRIGVGTSRVASWRIASSRLVNCAYTQTARGSVRVVRFIKILTYPKFLSGEDCGRANKTFM